MVSHCDTHGFTFAAIKVSIVLLCALVVLGRARKSSGIPHPFNPVPLITSIVQYNNEHRVGEWKEQADFSTGVLKTSAAYCPAAARLRNARHTAPPFLDVRLTQLLGPRPHRALPPPVLPPRPVRAGYCPARRHCPQQQLLWSTQLCQVAAYGSGNHHHWGFYGCASNF